MEKLYRDHRGTLEESMKTVQIVESLSQIKNHLKKIDVFNRTIKNIGFKFMCYDQRIAWNTYYVIAQYEGQTRGHVVGMTNCILT